jgi:predicted XRE-type DNA-binding protein
MIKHRFFQFCTTNKSNNTQVKQKLLENQKKLWISADVLKQQEVNATLGIVRDAANQIQHLQPQC